MPEVANLVIIGAEGTVIDAVDYGPASNNDWFHNGLSDPVTFPITISATGLVSMDTDPTGKQGTVCQVSFSGVHAITVQRLPATVDLYYDEVRYGPTVSNLYTP